MVALLGLVQIGSFQELDASLNFWSSHYHRQFTFLGSFAQHVIVLCLHLFLADFLTTVFVKLIQFNGSFPCTDENKEICCKRRLSIDFVRSCRFSV